MGLHRTSKSVKSFSSFGINVSLTSYLPQHLVASRKHVPDPITFTTAAYNQLRLNQLDPEMFPLQKYRLDALKDLSSKFLSNTSLSLFDLAQCSFDYIASKHRRHGLKSVYQHASI